MQRFLSNTLHRVGDVFWDILFPRLCVVCNTEGAFLCSQCVYTLTSWPQNVCAWCRGTSERSNICESCSRLWGLDDLWIGYRYDDVHIAHMIHTLKYGYREALGMDLGIILGSRMIDEYSDTDAIVPIPLDKIRYKERGFNQSLCLAQGIAQVCQRAIYSRLLIRTVARAPQATLGVSARWENMEDVYSVVCTRDIPKRIILVDDVTTTGATLRSAARALRMAGAEKISALVFAHGIPPRHTPVR